MKMKFLGKNISDTILSKLSMVCTKIRMQSLPKMVKIEESNTQSDWKQFLVFTEYCAFCLCEVLTRCHRYVEWKHLNLDKCKC